MPIKFESKYTISPNIIGDLMRIEAAKEKVLRLPITLIVLQSLRETTRLYAKHYATRIEGNQL
jgi:hypothetical protein